MIAFHCVQRMKGVGMVKEIEMDSSADVDA